MGKTTLQKLIDLLFGETILLNLAGVSDSPGDSVFVSERKREASSPQIPNFIQPPQKAIQTGNGIEVIDLAIVNGTSLQRQPDIRRLRNYAKHSTWVRAAIDYRREKIGRAHPELIPIDSTVKPNRLDKRVRAEVEKVLRRPNPAGESYGQLKEQMLEDYYVLGHGCLELDLYNDLTVSGINAVDAARIGFNKKWNAKNVDVPRFVEFSDKYTSKIARYLANEQLMCLVNRPMTDSKLGLSHVEILHLTVTALLTGDEFLLDQLVNPVSEKLISLGEGVTNQQVESFKHQIRQVKDKLAVIGGAKDPKVLSLSGSAEEMKILDGQVWFVRQVAAIFNISTAKLKLAVDTSRANTSEMLSDDLESLEGDLTRITELENACLIDRYGYLGDINLQFSYPILHRRDEKQQALIAKQQTGNQPWASLNEARQRTGEKALEGKDYPYADEPIVNTKNGPVPYSIWVKQMQDLEKNIGMDTPALNANGEATANPAPAKQ